MAGYKENKDFTSAILPQYLLDDAIDWIRANMNPEDVFDDAKLVEWAKDWAVNNDYAVNADNKLFKEQTP